MRSQGSTRKLYLDRSYEVNSRDGEMDHHLKTIVALADNQV